MCKQKITERCVNISKIKKNYLSPTTPFALYRGKNSATKSGGGATKIGNIGKIGIIGKIGCAGMW